uniref:Uncharacterized protein n=1 Tax=Anguilla anguilla TaxID=7936 RepID=A0A0E9QAL4_ANGAN
MVGLQFFHSKLSISVRGYVSCSHNSRSKLSGQIKRSALNHEMF